MSTEKQSHPQNLLESHGPNTVYRRAILKALESLHDYQSRSNIDAIRRHTRDILEDHTWNDALFLQTFKSIVRHGEIDLFTKSTAELSPSFKRNRADSLLQRLEERLSSTSPPPLPVALSSTPPHSPIHHVPSELKPVPKRRSEHEKWKILSKKEYDHSTVLNPMDTH